MAVRRSSPPAPGFAPARPVEVEIGAPLPHLRAGVGELGIPYRSALCLVRLHGQPLGLVEIELPPEGVGPAALATAIEVELQSEIAAHLDGDGLPRQLLDADGLVASSVPACLSAREDLLSRPPFVSVTIPTRDRPDSAAEAVAALLTSRYPADRFEVIVVDNRPPGEGAEGAGAIAGVLSDERVRVLREPVSGGANARNRGLAEARGEIVAYVDDDAIVDRDWLAAVALAFNGEEKVGAVSGLVMPRELETKAQVWFEGYARFSRRLQRRAYDLGPNRPLDDPLFPFDVGVLGTGANMAFRTAALRAAGGFDPAFNTRALPNGTDVEALLRILLGGWTVVREPGAIVHHAHQREYLQLERRVYGYGLGLTAVLTKALLHNPRLLPELARKLPRGAAFALSPRSAKNGAKHDDFPPALTRLELRGMLRGPLAYPRGRREARRARRAAEPARHAGPPRKRLRVLLVTDSYPPLIGGATFWSRQVALGMSERGHTVEVATTWQPGAPAREEDEGVDVRRHRDLTSRVPWVSADPYKHNPPPFPDPEATLRLRRRITEFEPDLVHAYGWLTHSAAAALTGSSVPLLVSTQDYGNVCALRTLFRKGEICDGPALAKCLDCAATNYGAAKGAVAVAGVFASRPLVRRKATAFHSISRYVAGVVEGDLAGSGTPIEIVPNFSQDVPGKAVDETVLAQLPDRPFILYAGALRDVKGISELCAAYQRLADPPPLVLAGPPAPETPTEFPDRVTVLTNVPHPTLMAMWDRALFGVFPSKWPEPLGNVVFEAMGRGRAVIGTRPGGHEDMVKDGRTGLLVAAGDADELLLAMSLLIADHELREGLGQRAKARARAYSAAAVLPELERLYFETVTAGGVRR
ncbi:MAG TPA: glycosyltransferase [Solirubrobacterales bacterium]|nr:glycosyltransferase [Solirubrobacterales bacterium]